MSPAKKKQRQLEIAIQIALQPSRIETINIGTLFLPANSSVLSITYFGVKSPILSMGVRILWFKKLSLSTIASSYIPKSKNLFFKKSSNHDFEPLKSVGYHTAIIGKWHLGLEAPSRPIDHGFDHFHGFLGEMMDDYWSHNRHEQH